MIVSEDDVSHKLEEFGTLLLDLTLAAYKGLTSGNLSKLKKKRGTKVETSKEG